MPEQITLIVKYIGGYGLAKDTQLVEVIIDGARRKPKTNRVDIAMTWLMAQNYQPQSFTWLDQPGLLSRLRRQVYTCNSN